MDQPNGEVSIEQPKIDPKSIGVVIIKISPRSDGQVEITCGVQNVDKRLARTAMINSLASLDQQIRADEAQARKDAVVLAKQMPQHGKII